MARGGKADRVAVPQLLKAYDGDVATVASHLQRDARFVKRWAKRCAAGEGVGNKQGQGRKRLLTGTAVSAAKRMADGPTKTTSKVIAKRLHDSGKTRKRVSTRTIQRALLSGRAPTRYVGLIRRQHLTDRHKEARLEWCRQHLNVDWERVMVTDSHITVLHKATGRKRWQNMRRRKTVETKHHGLTVHLYLGGTINGISKSHLVSGTTGLRAGMKGVTSEEYQQVIEKTFVPEGRRLFSGQPFTVYQDGAPAHTAVGTKRKWQAYHDNVSVLQAPPLSPDLNWIENVWNELDDKLMGRKCKTMTSFKAAIESALAKITPEYCRMQVESMPRRLHKVIEMQGGHIERNIYT